ncbi:glutaredoxin family protein [Candidatus Bathyarchaeota archaeon]|nr:glutaredoxin family protein [Candidatus Bathyarchaeota archaeon]
MYTLSSCPWCRKAKQFFKDRNITFEYVDYDLASEEEQRRIREEMLRHGGSTAFPFVRIGEDVTVGYNPERYSELLELG